jgi:hypothetical protein
MTTEITTTNQTSLVELYKNRETSLLMPRDVATKFLNVDPPASWVKTHPMTKHKYLPIDKVEFLLKVIFGAYRIERLSSGQLLNSIEYHVRVHYKDLTTGEWMWHDGSGAWEIQTEAKSGPLKADLSNINRGAITMALPIAKTQAIKDACDHLGTVFGSNLGRKDTVTFADVAPSVIDGRVKALIDAAATPEELEALREHLTDNTYPYFETKLNSFTNGKN